MWGPQFWVTSWCERFIKTEPSQSGCWRLASWRKSTLRLANLRSGFWGSLPVRDILSTNQFLWGESIAMIRDVGDDHESLIQLVDAGFKYFLYFHPETWGRFPIWRAYFSDGLVQPPTRLGELSLGMIERRLLVWKFPQLPQLWTWQEHNPAKLKSRVLIVERRYAARKLKGVAWHGGMACGMAVGGRRG